MWRKKKEHNNLTFLTVSSFTYGISTALTTQVDNATFEGGALKDLRGLHFAARPKEGDHVV